MKTLDQVKPIANDLSEPGHTPGPWHVGFISKQTIAGGFIGIGNGCEHIAKVAVTLCVPASVAKKNAALIAAAPELLAVLERFIALGKSGADTSWYSDDAQDTFYAMMRAIGTAKGEI